MSHKLVFTSILGLLLFIGSCRQEEELYSPEIIFTQPSAGYIADLPDTLDVRVMINDYRIIRTAVLTLVNEDKIPIIPGNYYYPNSTDFKIEASLPLEDNSIVSGSYNLLVTVSDGKDQKNKYLPIILHGISLRLEAYIVVTGQFDFKSTIIKLNASFIPDTQFVFPHGYWLSAVQSKWGEYFFVTGEPSNLISFNPVSFETVWEMAAAPPRPLITALIPDHDLVFATANGDAGILSYDGNISLRTQSFDNKTIQCLAANDNYIFAAHVSLSGNIHELTVFSRLSGDIWEQRLISGEIRSLVPVGDKLLVIVQSGNDAKIMDYDPKNFILTELYFLPGEDIKSAIKISGSQIFIITLDNVISFNPELNQIDYFKNEAYEFGRYEPINDVIFLVRDTTLFGFNRINGDLMEEKSFPEKILDFQILYNKSWKR